MFIIGVSTHIIAFYSLIIIGLILATNNMKVLGQAPIQFYDNKSIQNISALHKLFVAIISKAFFGVIPVLQISPKRIRYFDYSIQRIISDRYYLEKPLRAPPAAK